MALDAIKPMAYNAIMRRATSIVNRRPYYEDGAFTEIKIWNVPSPVPPAEHRLKYSCVYIVNGQRIVGYDNERGKGDHRHIRGVETPYTFLTLQRLLDDFTSDVEKVRKLDHEGEHKG